MESLKGSLIYLDFESNKAGKCFLAGMLRGSNFRQIFLDPALGSWAKEKKCLADDPIAFTETIVKGVCEGKGTLVAYSEHEKKLIESIVGKNAIDGSYCNLLKAAKKWIRIFRRPEFEGLPPLILGAKEYDKKRHVNSLASVMRLTTFPIPRDYGIGHTTARINAVLLGLKRTKGDFSKLTSVQKAKATKVLKHNKFDVFAMQILYQTIFEDDPQIIEDASS